MTKEGKRRPTQKEKTLRAFGAYLELLDTAAWLKSWMHGPLASVDLTMQGFRLLVLLYRDGPTPMSDAAKQMRFPRQNLEFVLRRLEKRGWVCRENVRAEARSEKIREERKVRRARLRPAWHVGIIRLTPEGERFVGHAFPQHAKVVKALMRALDGREQETLGEICRKLRAGHILKFMSEIAHQDAWENDAEDAGLPDEAGQPQSGAFSQLLQPRAESADDVREAPKEASEQVPEDVPEQGMLRALSRADRERLARIARTMRNHDIVRYARTFFWDEPPDRDRDSEKAVQILMGIAAERERAALERLARTTSAPEIIEFLEGMTEPVTTE